MAPKPSRSMLGKQSSGILSPPSPKIEAIPLISATHRINDGELLHLVGSGTELGKKLLRNRVIVRFATGSAALSQNDKIEEMYAWLEDNTIGLFPKPN